MYENIIIGAGPAGIMCAINAQNKTLLLEKNSSIGKKLSLTGNKRCNITNISDEEEFRNNIHNYKFLYSALSKFSNYEIIDFFHQRNLFLKEEDHGRMFPISNNALDIIELLQKEISCDLHLNEEVLQIEKKGDYFHVITNLTTYKTKNLMIATGGKSYPHTGSDGFGYKIAKQFGHTIEKLQAAEAALYSDDIICKTLQGVTIDNAKLTVGRKTMVGFNLLFTHFGLSGPLAMRLAYELNKTSIKTIELDLIEDLSVGELEKLLTKQLTIKKLLKPYTTNSVINFIINTCQTDPNLKAHQISKNKRREIVEFIKKYQLNIKKTAPVEKSFVTAGGIKLNEINPKTFESKLVKNLYFIGEVLDLHAHTGGYNLTICMSMGYNCALNIKI